MKYSLKHPWKFTRVRKFKITQKRSIGKVYRNIWSGRYEQNFVQKKKAMRASQSKYLYMAYA